MSDLILPLYLGIVALASLPVFLFAEQSTQVVVLAILVMALTGAAI